MGKPARVTVAKFMDDAETMMDRLIDMRKRCPAKAIAYGWWVESLKGRDPADCVAAFEAGWEACLAGEHVR